MAGGLSLLEPNLNVVAGAAIRLASLFLPIIGEKGAWNGELVWGSWDASRIGVVDALERFPSQGIICNAAVLTDIC